MFEEEKRKLEEAREKHQEIQNALLDKSTLHAIKYIHIIMLGIQVGTLGIALYIGNGNIYALLSILAICVGGDALSIRDFHKKNKEYQTKYGLLKELSLEELQNEEEACYKKVQNLRNELEFEMSASKQEKEKRNGEQNNMNMRENYSTETKRLVKSIGSKRS